MRLILTLERPTESVTLQAAGTDTPAPVATRRLFAVDLKTLIPALGLGIALLAGYRANVTTQAEFQAKLDNVERASQRNSQRIAQLPDNYEQRVEITGNDRLEAELRAVENQRLATLEGFALDQCLARQKGRP